MAPLLAALLTVLVGPGGTAAQEATPKQEPKVGEEALRWERDFDLLLDLKNIPSHADLVREARIEELKKERGALQAHLEDLQKRLAALQGTYTTETLLNEMLRQGVSSVQQVHKNLKDEMDQTSAKIEEVDDRLHRLGVPRGG